MSSNRSGEVYVIGSVLDAFIGVPEWEDEWAVVSRPESETWPERVWSVLAEVYLARSETDVPDIYDRDSVITTSVCGWGGVELFGSILRLVCIECGATRVEDPELLYDGDVPECLECGGAEVPDIRRGELDTAEEMVREAAVVVFVGVEVSETTLALLDAAAGARVVLYGSVDDWPSPDVWDAVIPLAAAV